MLTPRRRLKSNHLRWAITLTVIIGIFGPFYLIFKQDDVGSVSFSENHMQSYSNVGRSLQDVHKQPQKTRTQEPAKGKKKHRILAPDKFIRPYTAIGGIFNSSGKIAEVAVTLTTSLVYSFSPFVENKVKKIFPDPVHQNVFYANSPAITWHNDQLVTVLRIWLEEERYEKREKPYNFFADNYFYTQNFDGNFKPLTNGSLLGIPTTKAFGFGDGPIEPRMFKVYEKDGKERLFVTFNTAVYFKDRTVIDYTMFWDFDNSEIIIPRITNGGVQPTKYGMPRDKHWAAFNLHGQLHFVHNLDPLRILRCTIKGVCSFIHKDDSGKNIKFKDNKSHLRGGTPFEHYSGKYYVGVAHGTFFKAPSWKRFYTTHLVVLHVEPFRIVYVSNDILVHHNILFSVPIVRARYIQDPFLFPVGIILEDPDTLYLGVHISDYSSVLLRMRGLKNLMTKVIEADKNAQSTRGPVPWTLQNFVWKVTSSEKHKQFAT
ncbi:uncharacterized protein LOC106165762 [Lingula anatina]|uniref:Uncharacterized protein LOC106165762 n=1 Tax=Lingula anatina TaxID=7574 RepID=A0A1S3IMZ9_LINAN|nr:uncharacterized protein LOC106165762 [Lingula anatina]XP_013399570.1 uncharacterized protein LOC106165762 [Lingula anatina]XP_013399571.1 uncharacterized protein LOC106165762 [Lingula anatina]XP_013399572.1 uncharacterized protein LOC106165762 [Lingula anatina]|eukprot:XP_013399569.1 uncharacterized protein LOC106165762 [Lingula anatina]